MRHLLRWLDHITLVTNVVGSLLICALVLLIGADVAGRNLFGTPLPGVPELVSLSIVAIVFLQAPMALKSGRMTRSDGILKLVLARSPRFGSVLETLYDLIAAMVVGAIVYATWPVFVKSWQRDDFVGAIGEFTAPTWPVKAMILLGAVLLALQFLARTIRRFDKQPDDAV